MKKLLVILSSVLLISQSSMITDSCKKAKDGDNITTNDNDSNIKKINDQNIYETKTKVVLVKINNVTSNANLEASSSDENKLSVMIDKNHSSKEKGYFELQLIGKLEGTSKVTVKYGEFSRTFNVNIIKEKADIPHSILENQFSIKQNIKTPFSVDFLNPVKDCDYEVIAVDDQKVNITKESGKDTNGNGRVIFEATGLMVGKTRLIINYENSQVIKEINIEKVEEQTSTTSFKEVVDETMIINETINKIIIVNKAIEGKVLEFNSESSNLEIKFNEENHGIIEQNENYWVYLLKITSKNNISSTNKVNLKFDNVETNFNVDIKDTPKFSSESPVELEASTKGYKKLEIKVDNRIKYANIKLLNKNKENLDAFLMSDYDAGENSKIELVVYGLVASTNNKVVLSYYNDTIKSEISIDVKEPEKKEPVISGIDENSTVEMDKNQSRAMLFYIDNPLKEESLTTTFDNEKYKNKLKVEVKGYKGDPYYHVFVISDSQTILEPIEVELNYTNAKPLKFKVIVK
ncbi:hypothetical protein SGLAD_v1c00730 [Spiroplasma gladiatoris]|uniref:Uncharacterized protein n=1 Tax=Spiroplasma gladiatoris TaxID=2143 RepID=A0A4P7AG13_9MOLU|nr:hypothetical protein [Spiroplasma gladiatoris]QBQ07274.1 hypothetical protein SGLAD_v1c00730 [Spiroplasma gladiatoris]